jgi:arabinan endo-1,5-alpha-L-arabinosidase
MIRTEDIQIRDPFVLPRSEEGAYYLFGTTDPDAWRGAGRGFDCYRGADLASWEGPFPAFRPPRGFWATTNFWAPEAHRYRGRFYLFASFKAPERYRGTQILAADRPEGPYAPVSAGPVTPPEWECLDGTLHVDGGGRPWIVFCQEWVQIHNGAVWAMPLSEDLMRPAGRPMFLFNASEAPWVRRLTLAEGDPRSRFPCWVTDGPFLHRAADGALLMLWSSMGSSGYAMGIARSAGGAVEGPWVQRREPLWRKDGGHGMVFRAFDGRLFMSLHTPNKTPLERAVFVPLVEREGTLAVAEAL